MKTTDPRDPLDRKIDTLLASRPLQPRPDFAMRVLAAADALPAQNKPTSTMGHLLYIALPVAAALAVALTLTLTDVAPTHITAAHPLLTASDLQEIFLLEEGLSPLAKIENEDLGGNNLLNTLDALYFDIQS
jgi:hypothetical protein